MLRHGSTANKNPNLATSTVATPPTASQTLPPLLSSTAAMFMENHFAPTQPIGGAVLDESIKIQNELDANAILEFQDLKIDPKDIPVGYQPPGYEKLCDIHNKLDKIYDGKDPVSLQGVAFIRKVYAGLEKTTLSEKEKAQLLAGACYKGMSEWKSQSNSMWGGYGAIEYFKGEGRFCKNLCKEFDCGTFDFKLSAETAPVLKHRFTCIHQLLNRKEELKLDSVEIKALEAEQAALKVTLEPIIKEILSRPPTDRFVRESFEKLPQQYETAIKDDSDISKMIGDQEKHLKYMKYFRMLADPELKKYANLELDQAERENLTGQVSKEYAAVSNVYVQTYKKYGFSHRLRDMCSAILNVHSVSQLPKSVLNANLAFLLSVNTRLVINPAALNYLKKYDADPKTFLESIDKEFSKDLYKLTNQEESEPSLTSTSTSYITWIARLGIGFISGRVVGAACPLLCKNILSNSAGVLGYIYYGPTGQMVFKSAGSVVETLLVGQGASLLKSPLGAALGYVAGGVMGVAVKVTSKGAYLFGFNPNRKVDADPDQDFLETLYDMSSPEERKILDRVIDRVAPANETVVQCGGPKPAPVSETAAAPAYKK